jgi:small neutral amino acid transporter SnatA (MarC family)
MLPFIKSMLLLLILLNPFLLVVYLMDLVQDMEKKVFSRILLRAGIISLAVFVTFAAIGETIFTSVIQARFASFQIFGGVVFLLIGIRFVFSGNEAVKSLRGDPRHVAGSIAMPIMIGPGTVSASVLAGQRLGLLLGSGAIVAAVTVSILVMILLKMLYDFVQQRNEELVERYVEITGRITALVVGTFSIEMIMQGVSAWMKN